MQVPATVQAGDTLLIFLTIGTISGTLGSPTGWTLVQSKDGATTRGRAWTKKATASDANANVTVASSVLAKSAMSVSAYRSSAGTSAITASASTAGTTSTTSHTAPSVAVAQPGSWLVNSWSEKSSTDSTWTPPADSITRATAAATLGGKVSSLLADSDAAVPTGTAAGRIATTSVAAAAPSCSPSWSAPGSTPASRRPTAHRSPRSPRPAPG